MELQTARPSPECTVIYEDEHVLLYVVDPLDQEDLEVHLACDWGRPEDTESAVELAEVRLRELTGRRLVIDRVWWTYSHWEWACGAFDPELLSWVF